MPNDWIMALIGGGLIAAASLLMLLFLGRIFGVSGIIGGMVQPKTGDVAWRLAVLMGMAAGGLTLIAMNLGAFDRMAARSLPITVIAGLLVGFGTRLGSGCTSGHGVCGVGRFSPRSLVATALFVAVGMITATFLGRLG